jgi:putative transposase
MTHAANNSKRLIAHQDTFQHMVWERLKEVVRAALISVLEDEVLAFMGAASYECNQERRDHRSGHYTRHLETPVR